MFEKHNEILKKGIDIPSFSLQHSINFDTDKEYTEYVNAFQELKEKGLVDVSKSGVHLTPLGRKIYKGIGVEKHFRIVDRKSKRQNSKEYYDFLFSKSRVITFWILFCLSLIGGVMGIYDFLYPSKTEKDIEQLIQSKEELESELSKLRTLILDQKNPDSLHTPKTP